MSGQIPHCSQKRVLVVDDHRAARESVAFVLGQAGYKVCCSSRL